jgi:hypothetical protein
LPFADTMSPTTEPADGRRVRRQFSGGCAPETADARDDLSCRPCRRYNAASRTPSSARGSSSSGRRRPGETSRRTRRTKLQKASTRTFGRPANSHHVPREPRRARGGVASEYEARSGDDFSVCVARARHPQSARPRQRHRSERRRRCSRAPLRGRHLGAGQSNAATCGVSNVSSRIAGEGDRALELGHRAR